MLTIDGAEGGGSVLRVALPLSISINEPIKIINIRKSRRKPGLRPQHLQGIQYLAKLTGSELLGARIGSTEISFIPEKAVSGTVNIDLDTAASISLIFQLFSNYCMANDVAVSLHVKGGGTHTNWSPSFDYLEHVTRPALDQFGQSVDFTIHKYGFYPKGGARVDLEITQQDHPMIEWNEFKQNQIKLISIASHHLKNAKVADRQTHPLEVPNDQKEIRYVETLSPGSSLTALLLGRPTNKAASGLGERGVKSEEIGKRVLNDLENLKMQKASVDRYLADQLMVALAFSPKNSYYTIPEITNHVKINLQIIEQILDHRLEIQQRTDYFVISRV